MTSFGSSEPPRIALMPTAPPVIPSSAWLRKPACRLSCWMPVLPDYPVIYANAAFLTLTDYAPEEVLGSSHRLFTGSATDPGSADRVETALADRRELRLDIRCVRRDGTLFWADVFLSPIQSISGRVLWYLVSYQDISRQRKAEWDAMDWAGLLE